MFRVSQNNSYVKEAYFRMAYTGPYPFWGGILHAPTSTAFAKGARDLCLHYKW